MLRRGVLKQRQVVGIAGSPVGEQSNFRVAQPEIDRPAFRFGQMKRLKILAKQIIAPQRASAAERKWLGGISRQHQIVAAGAMPQRSVRKMARYPVKDHRKIIEGQTVGLYPLNETAPRGKMFVDHVEKFVGVERSDSRDPRIRRFGNDQVVLFAAGLQEIPRVVKVEMQPRIA